MIICGFFRLWGIPCPRSGLLLNKDMSLILPKNSSSIYRITEQVAENSPCLKRKVGASFSLDNLIISTGFNHGYGEECQCRMGTPNPDCLHAEVMTMDILKWPVPERGLLLITYQPCLQCAEYLLQTGVKNISYRDAKPADTRGVDFLIQHNININTNWK